MDNVGVKHMAKRGEERVTLLRALLQRKREGTDLDYKQELHLDTRGDKAEFVKDVLALANSADVAYIVTGVEDETWKPVGITKQYKQARLNQILSRKTDPRLQVEYVELELDDLEHGLVTIKATDPPYLVAVQDHYGGRVSTSRKKQTHIVRGTIYVRIEDQNEGASRAHVDQIYEATYGLHDKAAQLTKRFIEEEVLEMDRYALADNESFVRVLICPVDVVDPMLDRLDLSESGFQNTFRETVLSVPYIPPDGTGPRPVSALRYPGAGEETVELRGREERETPSKILKMDIRGNVSWGHLLWGDEVMYFDLLAVCKWIFQVVARLYDTYDSDQRVDKVRIWLRLRNFKHKPLTVQMNLPGFFNHYRYEGEEDPRIFPDTPVEASASDLAERPEKVAEDLLKLFRRSYPRQVG